MNNRFDYHLFQWLVSIGVPEKISQQFQFILELFILIILCYLTDRLAKKLFIRLITSVIKKTKFLWDDILLENKVFDRLAHLAPAFMIQISASYVFADFQDFIPFLIRMTDAYIIGVALMLVIAIFNTLDHYFKQIEGLKDKPIDSYFQLSRLISYFIGGVLIIGKVFDKDPQGILTAMGALTAVSMLVFKDTILGFVASIQLSANDMIRVGDWVSIPKYGADGDVIKITLNTVKVQNWDKTISTIPTYSFVSDSFKNWRGMSEAGGRRIKRSIVLKSGSIKFCSQNMISNYKKLHLISDYINNKEKEIITYNKDLEIDKSISMNGRNLTNIGVFRIYSQKYISSLNSINTSLTCMVLQKQGNEYGVPIEIYCFTKTTEWSQYESVQADIFDHLYASAKEFDLEVFQHPSGKDFNNIIN